MQIHSSSSSVGVTCSCCNNEPQTELINEDFVLVQTANISSMVKDDDWGGHNLEYLKYYDRLYKLCSEANPDDPNSFTQPVCYNCLTRAVQKSIRNEITSFIKETATYRNAIQILKVDNEKIPDLMEDFTSEINELSNEDNKLVEELENLVNECSETDKQIEREEMELLQLKEEENQLTMKHNYELSKIQELKLILLENEKLYDAKVSFCEYLSKQSVYTNLFQFVNHENYASVNGLRLDKHLASIQELNGGLGHVCTCLYKVIGWLQNKYPKMEWKGTYHKNYTLIPLGSKSYFENKTDYIKFPMYQESVNVVGWIASFLSESPFDKAMVIFLHFVFEIKTFGEDVNPNLFQPIRGIRLATNDRIDYNLEYFYVKSHDGKHDSWAKSMNLLVKVISYFLLWIKEDQETAALKKEEKNQVQIGWC